MPLGAGILIRNKLDPTLGPGRIVKIESQGRVSIRFLWRDVSYTIDPQNANLERYILFGFTPVRLTEDGQDNCVNGFVTRKLGGDNHDEWTYEVVIPDGDGWSISAVKESAISPLPPENISPLEQFRTLTWQSPKRFLRRWKLLLSESNWFQESGGITAFLGARVHPMGHQLYAARRVLWDRSPRFILADEVGLGKTIEAGLIVQALKTYKSDLRVLIVTPGSMARQWQTEFYLRFGAQAYKHVDSTFLQGLSAASRKDLLSSDNLIVTATALQASEEARRVLARQTWDIVIIDEAHQFPPGTELYTFFHSLARSSAGLLALSATPSKRQMASLSGLLALVSPDIYDPEGHEFLERRISVQRDVWDRLSFTRKYLEASYSEGTPLEAEDLEYLAEQWEDILTDDKVVTSLVSQLKEGKREAADELIAYVQEFHRLDHRIIRTRRSSLLTGQQPQWSERVYEVLEYDSDSDESVLSNLLDDLPQAVESDPSQSALRGLYHRAFCSTPTRLVNFLRDRREALESPKQATPLADPIGLLTADPSPPDEEFLIEQILQSAGPLPGEKHWLTTALDVAEGWVAQELPHARTRALYSWLKSHLEESPSHQVLLFAQDGSVVVELVHALQSLLPGTPVKSFHHGMSEGDLAKVALDFQRNNNCRVLVSDELGGEGRNFQNASALVHFDLPWSVSRVEQRVGRLDRVGRGANRPVRSVVLCGPTPMERSLLGVHTEVFKVLSQSVGGLEYALPKFQRDLNEAICRGADSMADLAESLKPKVAEELQDVDEAFELSLDASKVHLLEAQKLAELLKEASLKDDSYLLIEWAGKLGIKVRPQPNKSWELKWAADELQRGLRLPRSTYFMTGTFDRTRALNDDTQQLFSPGHPLVDALTADLHSSGEGRASVMFLKLDQKYKGRLFALVLGRCALNEGLLKRTAQSPGLTLRAQRFLWPDIQSAVVELLPGQTPAATLVTDPNLALAMRLPQAVSTQHKPLGPNELQRGLDDVKTLWDAVEEAIPVAVEHMRELRTDFMNVAADQLSQDLRAELGYLSWKKEQCTGDERRQFTEEIEARHTLVEAVKNEQIAVEAVAVVVGN